MSELVCLAMTDGGPQKHTAHLLDNDFPWWLHQVKMLEEMGRRRRKRKEGWRVGRGEGGMKRMTDLLGLGWNAPFLPNLLLYFEKQQEGCRGRKEAGDGWSDMRALTALMNGSSTKWTHHHGGDRGRQKRQRTFHYWGMIALTKWAFCHGVIFELLFAQKV